MEESTIHIAAIAITLAGEDLSRFKEIWNNTTISPYVRGEMESNLADEIASRSFPKELIEGIAFAVLPNQEIILGFAAANIELLAASAYSLVKAANEHEAKQTGVTQ